VLQIDSHTLLQSLPIIEYLDQTRPEPRLIPQDPLKAAQARAIAEIVNSGIQPYQNTNVIYKIF
jgi:maleylacetoacetate isomerase